MPDDDQPSERTPKGAEVPIPKREGFFANLKKTAKPDTPTASICSIRASISADGGTVRLTA